MSKINLNPEDKLVLSNILNQAECFLLELGCFYPFGVELTNKKEIVPFSIYFDDTETDITKMIDEYNYVAKLNLSEKKAILYAIVTEILLDESDALHVRLIDEAIIREVYIKFKIFDNHVEFIF
jgi:hypothetical protein